MGPCSNGRRRRTYFSAAGDTGDNPLGFGFEVDDLRDPAGRTRFELSLGIKVVVLEESVHFFLALLATPFGWRTKVPFLRHRRLER